MYQPNNILGLSIGTTRIGIAILTDDILIDWYTKEFSKTWSASKKDFIIDTLDWMLDRYNIQVLVIKVPLHIEKYPTVIDLHTDINLFAQHHDITTNTITIQDLKQYVNAENKAEVRRAAFKLFPELKHEYSRQELSRNQYHTKLFEAVLSAHFQQSVGILKDLNSGAK